MNNDADADDIRPHVNDRELRLLLASEGGRIDEVNELIEQGVDVDFMRKTTSLDGEITRETAASVAFARGHHDVVLTILKANSKYPHNYHDELASEELREFVNLSINLHARIRVGNLREILAENSNLKYIYDLENNSLIKTALERRRFVIFRILWENNLKLAPHEDIWDILRSFSNDELNNLRNIQLIDFERLFELSEKEICEYRDIRGFNALMIASECDYINAVSYCLEKGFFIIDATVNSISAADLALANNNLDILLLFLKFNSEFPNYFNTDGILHEGLESFIEMSLRIHFYIDMNETQKIKEILNKKPNIKFFYDPNNRSAFRHAVKDRKFEVYKVLVENFITFGPNENYNEIRRDLSDDDLEQMNLIQFELSEALISPTVLTLMAHSFVGHESKALRRSLAMDAFLFLLKLPRAEKVLKIVATQKNYQIVFDFARNSIEILDATAASYMDGSFESNGRIYIAAAKLFNDEEKYEVFAALAHELCHFAMNITFDNMARPYGRDDEESRGIFEKIIEECEELKGDENIIKSVYNSYEEELHATELIVRPVHMDAHYHGLPQKGERSETFKSLYDFYDNKCVPAMEKILPELEAKANFTEKDEKIKKLKKFNVFLAIMIALAIAVGALVAYKFFISTRSWSDLTPREQDQFKNTEVDYHNVTVKFNELFANDSNVYDLLSPRDILSTLEGRTSHLSKVIHDEFEQYIFMNWQNMTAKLKEKFLTFTVDFQGVQLSFDKFLGNYSCDFQRVSSGYRNSALNFLNAKEIRGIFNENYFKISSKVEINVRIYIERYFVEESVVIFEEYQNDGHKGEEKFYLEGNINANNSKVVNTQKLFDEILEKNIFLVSSLAGDGKSTSFQHFGWNLKQDFPFKWFQYVELKNFTAEYKTAQNISFNELEVLLDFIGKTMFKLSTFEFGVFSELFKSNNVVFLWDGVDEISPDYLDLFTRFTSKVATFSRNLQFISTRPQYSATLQKIFSTNAYKLVPYGRVNRYEFLLKTSTVENGPIDENKVFDELNSLFDFQTNNFTVLASDANFVEKISQKLQIHSEVFQSILKKVARAQVITLSIEDIGNKNNDNFKYESLRIASNPLLVAMIGELANDESFPCEPSTMDLYGFYLLFLKRKIEIVIKKGNIVEKDLITILAMSTVNIMQIHQVYALKSIYGSTQGLSIMSLMHKISDEMISRFGIIQVNSDTDFQFAHQSFAEFLYTQYLIDSFDNLDAKSLDGQLKIFFFSFAVRYQQTAFVSVNLFINDYLNGNRSLSPFFTQWHEQMSKNRKTFKNPQYFENELLEDIQFAHYIETNYNFFGLKISISGITYCFEQMPVLLLNSTKFLKNYLGDDMFRYALTYKSIFDGFGVLTCAYNEDGNFIKYINIVLEVKNFTHADVYRLFLIVRYDDATVLMEASRRLNVTLLKPFWNIAEANLNEKELKALLN